MHFSSSLLVMRMIGRSPQSSVGRGTFPPLKVRGLERYIDYNNTRKRSEWTVRSERNGTNSNSDGLSLLSKWDKFLINSCLLFINRLFRTSSWFNGVKVLVLKVKNDRRQSVLMTLMIGQFRCEGIATWDCLALSPGRDNLFLIC